jgi:hypothetical protein
MFKKLGGNIVKFMTKTFVGRAVDNIALGGAINNSAIKTPFTNEGKFDWKETILGVVTSVIPVILLIAFLKGWVTIEEVKSLIKILIP